MQYVSRKIRWGGGGGGRVRDSFKISPKTFLDMRMIYNKKVSKFFSRFWNPGCSGVDFFVQNLKGENCFVVPPRSPAHPQGSSLYAF